VDLIGVWQVMQQHASEVVTLPDNGTRKQKVYRDQALFLMRAHTLSRSDDEAKWNAKDNQFFRCYNHRGEEIFRDRIDEALQEVINTDGRVERNYRDPKDPLKSGIWSNTVELQPLRINHLLDKECP
jgi:hypothetical protein